MVNCKCAPPRRRASHSLERTNGEEFEKKEDLDIHYLEHAENILYMELSIIFDVPKDEVPKLIHQTLVQENAI